MSGKKDFSKFVVVLGIIYDAQTNRILIGKRAKDPYIKNLTWCFPGGRLGNTGPERSLIKEIRKKTGISVKVGNIIFCRVSPENKNFLLLYYLCAPEGKNAKAGNKFSEVKWVNPSELAEYFTTSIDSTLLKMMIKNLDK